MIRGNPIFAALHGKITAQIAAPRQRNRLIVVHLVPAAVLHQGQRDPREHRRLRMRAGHSLILEDSFLPMRQRGALAALVLQFGALQQTAVEVPSRLLHHLGRDHHINRLRRVTAAHRPPVPRYLPDRCIAPLVYLQLLVHVRFARVRLSRGPWLALLIAEERVQADREAERMQYLMLHRRQQRLQLLRLRADAVRT